MAQLQAEAAAMECDSHGLTMLPFFSGGGSQGSSGVRSSHSPSPLAAHIRIQRDIHNWTKRKLISASRHTDFSFLLQGANPTTGTLTGMTLRTSRAGILRAIMESVALRLKGVFTSISSLLPDDSFEVSFLHLRYMHNMKLLHSLCFQIDICCSDVLLCSLSDSCFSCAAPNSHCHCINDVNRCMHPEMHCSSPRCGNRSWSTLSASGYISCPARNQQQAKVLPFSRYVSPFPITAPLLLLPPCAYLRGRTIRIKKIRGWRNVAFGILI